MTEIGDGLAVPVQIRISDQDERGHRVDIDVSYCASSGAYEANEIVIRRGDDGPEITGEVLRSVPVATMVRRGVADAVLQAAPAATRKAGIRYRIDSDGEQHIDPRSPAGPTDDSLRWAALVYRIAVLGGGAPTQEVANSLDIPRPTAARWVTRARDKGYLTVTDPRGGSRR